MLECVPTRFRHGKSSPVIGDWRHSTVLHQAPLKPCDCICTVKIFVCATRIGEPIMRFVDVALMAGPTLQRNYCVDTSFGPSHGVEVLTVIPAKPFRQQIVVN